MEPTSFETDKAIREIRLTLDGDMERYVWFLNNGYQADADVTAIQSKLFKESWYAWGEADVFSNMTEGALTLSDTRNIFEAQWEVGWQSVDGTD